MIQTLLVILKCVKKIKFVSCYNVIVIGTYFTVTGIHFDSHWHSFKTVIKPNYIPITKYKISLSHRKV